MEFMSPIRVAELTGEELVAKMTVAATELYSLGEDANEDNAVLLFWNTIPLIAKAWGLHGSEVAVADGILNTTITRADSETEAILDERVLKGDGNAETILSLVGALAESRGRLTADIDRERINDVISYLIDFWSLEERLAT